MDVDNALHLGFAVPGRILSIGVTGHREGNPAFAAHRIGIERTLATLLAAIKSRIASGAAPARARLVTNLANGCDLMAARAAVALDLDLITPLPFGDHVNRALNMLNMDWATAHTIAQGNAPADLGERANWQALGEAFKNAIAFELCDQDAALQECLLRLSTDGTNRKLMLEFESLVGTRTKAASRMTVEQSDILLAIWDGKSPSVAGGTRDTMAEALAADVPVIWLDASQPDCLHWLDDPGDLVIAPDRDAPVDLAAMTDLICANMDADWQELDQAKVQLSAASWRPRSRLRFHAYRRIETLFGDEGARFGSVRQSYQTPEAAAQAGEGTMLGTITALLQPDPNTATSLATKVVSRFAAADGISTYLSDAYRGGMAANFLLSAAAIIAGIAYLPLVGPDGKWPFALAELLLLLAIVALTVAGVRGQWHKRWFQTRRAAEYLRHAPIMVAIGCARPRGHWPSPPDARWPELYAREAIKGVGLPRLRITQDFLHKHLRDVLRPFFIAQQAYHRKKARRLERVHHNLDRMSETLFILAILSVTGYLLVKMAASFGTLDSAMPGNISKLTTFLGVAFPTLGAAIAGIRYFGDFDRFAAISDITALKLDRLIRRSDLLLASKEADVSYEDFVYLTRKMDDVVVEEIASWQSIFGTKKLSVPV